MEPTAIGRITVNAPPERVYALLSDLDSFSGLAEETVACRVLNGSAPATVGTRFRGTNIARTLSRLKAKAES